MTKDMQNDFSNTQHSMNDTKNVLIIANTTIRQDSEGRYCLNDCHKASRMGAEKRPSKWMVTQSSQGLIDELEVSPKTGFGGKLPFLKENINPVNIVKGGNNPGTYVVKELVYAYAMWISPSFNLQVIRAYDDLVEGRYQPVVDFNDPTFLRSTLLTYTEKCIALENENKELKPKADGYDLIATSDGSMCITDTAKYLQIRPKELFDYLKT